MIENKCKFCKYYIKDKSENNCLQNVVGKINSEDSACYKIEKINER